MPPKSTPGKKTTPAQKQPKKVEKKEHHRKRV